MIVVVPVALFLILLTLQSIIWVFSGFGFPLFSIIFAVAFIYFIVWFATSMFVAWHMNNAVKVSHDSFPEVQSFIDEAKSRFNYPGKIDAYVKQSSEFDISIALLLRKRAIIIPSELLEDIQARQDVRFLVGRFIGALASRHYRFLWVEILLTSIESLLIYNFLLYPYERAVQYTGDQLGLYFVDGDLDTASQVMLKFMVGRNVARQVNFKSVVEQESDTRSSFFVWLVRIMSPFPHLTSRLTNLVKFGHQHFPQETKAFLLKQNSSHQVANVLGLANVKAYERSEKVQRNEQSTPRLQSLDNPQESYALGSSSTKVGRSSNCDIVIDHGTVSRLHATITQESNGELNILDESSSNGTYIDGRKIASDLVSKAHANSEIYFGNVGFRFIN